MYLVCPKNSDHETFITKQKLIQEIQVGSDGNYQGTYNDSEVLETYYEDAVCSTCGAKAVDEEDSDV